MTQPGPVPLSAVSSRFAKTPSVGGESTGTIGDLFGIDSMSAPSKSKYSAPGPPSSHQPSAAYWHVSVQACAVCSSRRRLGTTSCRPRYNPATWLAGSGGVGQRRRHMRMCRAWPSQRRRSREVFHARAPKGKGAAPPTTQSPQGTPEGSPSRKSPQRNPLLIPSWEGPLMRSREGHQPSSPYTRV